MTILVFIALSLYAAILLTLVPFAARLMRVTIAQKEFEIFKTVAKDATSYVSQVALSDELSSEDKKSLASSYALELLKAANVTRFNCAIDRQIESSLWCDDNEIVEDDSDEDEDF